MVTAQWRSLKNEERLRLKKLLALNGKYLTCYNNNLDKTRFNREMKLISAHLGNKSLKNYMRDEKGNL